MGDYLGSAERRELLAATTVGGLGFAGGVFSNIRVAAAQALTDAPPEVDKEAFYQAAKWMAERGMTLTRIA